MMLSPTRSAQQTGPPPEKGEKQQPQSKSLKGLIDPPMIGLPECFACTTNLTQWNEKQCNPAECSAECRQIAGLMSDCTSQCRISVACRR